MRRRVITAMKLHAAEVSAVEMLSLAEVRVSGKQDRSPAVALDRHDDTIDVRGLIPGQVLSRTPSPAVYGNLPPAAIWDPSRSTDRP